MRIGNAFRGAKDAEELIALTANAAEEAEFLEDHGPGNDGEDPKQEQNSACDPAGFSKDAAKISNKNDREQENVATP